MDQSTSMDHNYGVPFIPSHLYQRNNSEVVHHVPLGCLHSLIRLKPQRLVEMVEGGEITRWLRGSQTRPQFWVSVILEEQRPANIFPCPLRQPQQVHNTSVKTLEVHGQRMIGLLLRTVIVRALEKLQEELAFLEKGWRGGWLHMLYPPPGIQKFQRMCNCTKMECLGIQFTHQTQAWFPNP